MIRAFKDATVKRFYYSKHVQLRRHLADFVSAYNLAKRLKTLKGLTLRVHLQDLDKRAGAIHPQSAPANAGIKHLLYGGRVLPGSGRAEPAPTNDFLGCSRLTKSSRNSDAGAIPVPNT